MIRLSLPAPSQTALVVIRCLGGVTAAVWLCTKSIQLPAPGEWIIPCVSFDLDTEMRLLCIVSLIWNFWGFKGVLCDPKTGRKLLLGQKHTEISFAVSQEEDYKKEELQDLVIWGGFPGYLRNVLLDPVQIFFLKSLQLVIFFNAFIITTFKTKI